MATTHVASLRLKTFKPKTKTGCKTCKIRRIKCDETKPYCRRCTTTGRTCDGYDSNFVPRKSSSPQVTNSSPSPSTRGRLTVNYNAPTFLVPSLHLQTADEHISLQFYIKHAGPALARSSNSVFWQRQVLQAANQHISVQHCIIALGAMYRRFIESTSLQIDYDVSDQHFRFALSQSNKAIQQLVRDQTEYLPADISHQITVMTCCVLFGSMANLQGQQKAALGHLRSGIRMLREIRIHSYKDLDSHPVNINSLRSIFTGLDIQARSSINWSDVQTWEPVVSSMKASEPADIDLSSPWALSELHCRLEILVNDTLAFNRGCVARPFTDREAIQIEHNHLVSHFQYASQTLNTFRPAINTPALNSSRTVLLHSQMHHWIRASISPLQRDFNIASPLAQTPYDPVEHFTSMMPHITFLLFQTSPSTPVYSASPGPLSALWLVGTSAPSSCVTLRKHALELMQKHPRREGLFDGLLASRIGKMAWDLEQDAARKALGLHGGSADNSEDLVVPEHLRIVFMDVVYPEEVEGKARVKLASAMDLGTGGGTTVELDW